MGAKLLSRPRTSGTRKTGVVQPLAERNVKWHASMSDVRVGRSKIKGAGSGLFASVALRAWTKLPQSYRGKKLTKKQWLRAKDHSYMMGLVHKTYYAIDARECLVDNPLRYVNGARTAAQRKKLNVGRYQLGSDVYYVTTKSVPADTELLVDYGESYWDGIAFSKALGELCARRDAIRADMCGASASKLADLELELEDVRDEERELRS